MNALTTLLDSAVPEESFSYRKGRLVWELFTSFVLAGLLLYSGGSLLATRALGSILAASFLALMLVLLAASATAAWRALLAPFAIRIAKGSLRLHGGTGLTEVSWEDLPPEVQVTAFGVALKQTSPSGAIRERFVHLNWSAVREREAAQALLRTKFQEAGAGQVLTSVEPDGGPR